VALALALAHAGGARADLAVFDNGRILKITSAATHENESVTLVLEGGGEMTLPPGKVARVLEDEIPDYSEELAKAATPYDSLIEERSEHHGADPRLVRAVVRVESNFDPAAVSRAGAMGLMQLMPLTARQYGTENPFDPKQNLDAGIRHLQSLLEKYDDLSFALAAYNAGGKAVERYGGVPPFRETQNYVRRVLEFYRGGTPSS
jgi:soluble lytic murein transglycosylase-like protein